jgi:hypothetical protein
MRWRQLSARIAVVECDVPQASRFTFHRCRAAKGSRKLTLAPACDQAGAFSFAGQEGVSPWLAIRNKGSEPNGRKLGAFSPFGA